MSAVDYQSAIEYPHSYPIVFNAITEALRNEKGFTLGKADESSGYIMATSGVTMASWGEIIMVQVIPIDSYRTQVVVKSSPSVSTTLVDWGKNKKNVNKIFNAISAILTNQPSTAGVRIADDQTQAGVQQFNEQPQQAYQPYEPQQAYQPYEPQSFEQPEQAYEQPSDEMPQHAYPPPPPPPQQPYQQQHNYQPYQQAYQLGEQPVKPPSNLVWSILCTLFCCWPLGVASIISASKVNSLYNAGDYEGAQEASDNAKKYAIWSAIAGVIALCVYLATQG